MPHPDTATGRHRGDGQSTGAQRRYGAPDHRSGRRRVALSAGHSPDLNPIAQGFSKLKAHLRNAQERSIDALWQRIGNLLDLFQPQECGNFFANSGYART
jgi:transposase